MKIHLSKKKIKANNNQQKIVFLVNSTYSTNKEILKVKIYLRC